MRVSLLLIVIPTVIGVPACINQFNPPQNRNALTWYPSNFTKTTVPMFPNNFDCEYGINVPQGWFVQIQLSVTCTNCNVGKDYDVVITDQLQRTERVSFADEERFYFIANGGKIKLTTRTDTVQFGFTMLWQPYSNTPPALLNVSQSDTQPTLIVRNGAQPAVVRGETKVSATVLAPQWWDENQYFRGVIFFDGPTWNATCLGTASQLSKGNTQYVSSGNYMSVLILEAFSFDYIDILLQDYSHTKDIVQFQGMECNWSEQCLFVKMMDASMGPVVFQTYTPVSRWPNVITGISGTGNLDVYIGGITSSNGTNLIASYQADKNNSLNLPQQFLGPIKTYVLTGGVANITMSDISNVFEETNSLPRHGFISSNQYGSYSTSQGSRSEITSPNLQRIKYSYSIQNVDFSGNATLKVIGYLNRSLAFSKSYNHSSSLAQEQFYGDTLYVDFRTESLPNTGFYLSFEMENANGSSKFCVFSVLLMVFVGCFF